MTRNRLRTLLLVLIIASLAGVGFKAARTVWKLSGANLGLEPGKLLDRLPEVALRVKDFHRTKIERGRTAWELTGEEIRYLRGEKQALIKKPRLTFYDEQGEIIEATGDEGHLYLSDEEVEQMKLVGAIRVSYRGYALETEEASYFKNKKQVVAPGKVTLKRDGLYLEGVGMEIALDQERIRLHKSVKSRFEPGALANLSRSPDGRKTN